MDFVKQLIADGYSLFNVNDGKLPVDGNGNYLLRGWQSMTADELKQHHNYSSTLWGFRTGLHSNGRRIMSLDFDCCGQEDSTGVRVGCEYTKTKLEEYKQFNVNDGFYYSSTKGNMNVLIDYTDCEQLVEYITSRNLSKAKKSHTDLEILLGSGHQQVIPPSQTKCKISKQLGEPRRFIGDKPILMLNEEMPIFEFIFDLLKATQVQQPPKRATSSSSRVAVVSPPSVVAPVSTMEPIKSDDKWIELLFNVIKNERDEKGCKIIDWDTWFKIAGVLKSNGYDFELFEQYSRPHASTAESTKLWNDIKKYKMSIYALVKVAKEFNPEGYKTWAKKHSELISAYTLSQGENDVARYIAPQLEDKIKFSNGSWYYYDERTHLWQESKDAPLAKIITHLQNEIANARSLAESKFADDLLKTVVSADRKLIEEKREKDIDFYNASYRNVTGSKFSSQLVKLLKEYLHEKDFDQKLDNNKCEIAYSDGILDLRTNKFRKGIVSYDYLTKTIPFPYEERNEANITKIREELKKICNYNEEHLEYYLSMLGYSFTGLASLLQLFVYIRGQKASNGKSVVLEALTALMPNYVAKISGDFLDKKNTTRHKTVQVLNGLRLGWMNEITTEKKDSEVIKEISDGTSMKYKKMYGCESEMLINFKMWMVANHTMRVDTDGGLIRRFRTMQMDSEFGNFTEDNYETKQFVVDTQFGSKLQNEYKHALLHLIFDYSNQFIIDGLKLKPFPKDWEEETKESMDDNDKFKVWFEENFEFGTSDKHKCSKKLFESILENSFKGKINFKDEVKKNKWNFKYDSQIKGEATADFGGGKGLWIGFKRYVPPEPM